MKKPKKDKNYRLRAANYKALEVVSNLAPLGVVVALTAEISQSAEPGLSVNFGIAGLTMIFIQTMASLGKMKAVLGNRVFTLAVFTLIVYLIRHIADEMLVALIASLAGTVIAGMFAKLNLKAKHIAEQEQEAEIYTKAAKRHGLGNV